MNKIFTWKKLRVSALCLWSVMLAFDCVTLLYIELAQNVTRHELLVNNWSLIICILIEAGFVYALGSKQFNGEVKNEQ